MSTSTVKKIESLLPLLSVDEQLSLIQEVADKLRRAKPGPPQSLRGVWKDNFPVDPDLDAAIEEIRAGWQENLVPRKPSGEQL